MGEEHNVFDTGHIKHPVGWSHQPLDDWAAYVKQEFTCKDEWDRKLSDHGSGNRGRELLGRDHRKLMKDFKSERIEVYDQDIHMTVPNFFGQRPTRGPDEAMVSTGAIGAHNWSATTRDRSAIAGLCGSHTRAAAATKGYTSAQLRVKHGRSARQLRTATRASQKDSDVVDLLRRSKSCDPLRPRGHQEAPDKTVHSTEHKLWPSRYTRKNGTMEWRNFVKTTGNRPTLCNQTTAMQMQQEYAPVASSSSSATSNINLKRLASWPFVKLRKWLGKNGFSKEAIAKCPGKEELLELWRVKKDFESGPKHRKAGDFRSHLVASKEPLGTASEGWDYTDTKSSSARHVHAGDYRTGEARAEGAHDRGDGKVERFFFGHEMGGQTAVKFQGPAFLQDLDGDGIIDGNEDADAY